MIISGCNKPKKKVRLCSVADPDLVFLGFKDPDWISFFFLQKPDPVPNGPDPEGLKS